jgi:hypothetical protein
MKKIVKVFLFVVVTLGFLTLYYIYNKRNAAIDYSNLTFSDLKNDLDAWNIVKDMDVGVKKNYSRSVIGKLMRVSAMRPDISRLDGNSLEVICLLRKPEYQELFEIYDFNDTSTLILRYLQNIKNESDASLKKLQQSLGGTECSAVKKQSKSMKLMGSGSLLSQ